MFVAKALEYTLRRVVLLTVNRSVLLQNTVDDIREGGQFRAFRWLASPISRRFRMPQHLPTVSRAMPNRLAASRWLRPSPWQASRTRRYRSTVDILPPSISKKDRRLQVAEFYAARSWEIPPLPWTNLSPPFSAIGSARKTIITPSPAASNTPSMAYSTAMPILGYSPNICAMAGRTMPPARFRMMSSLADAWRSTIPRIHRFCSA